MILHLIHGISLTMQSGGDFQQGGCQPVTFSGHPRMSNRPQKQASVKPDLDPSTFGSGVLAISSFIVMELLIDNKSVLCQCMCVSVGFGKAGHIIIHMYMYIRTYIQKRTHMYECTQTHTSYVWLMNPENILRTFYNKCAHERPIASYLVVLQCDGYSISM